MTAAVGGTHPANRGPQFCEGGTGTDVPLQRIGATRRSTLNGTSPAEDTAGVKLCGKPFAFLLVTLFGVVRLARGSNDSAADAITDFEAAVFQDGTHGLPYRFHKPPIVAVGTRYPLVLLLHGYGERGSDNQRQLIGFSGAEFWKKYPCFVVVPQCPLDDSVGQAVWVSADYGALRHSMHPLPTWPLQAVLHLLDKVATENPTDPNRVYVSGLSMGGFATWELLQRRPGFFAGAVPVCGGADLEFVQSIAQTPVWVWHGANDDIVKVQRSRDVVEAIRDLGGIVKYSEIPGAGHGVWSQAYADPEVWNWLFAQSRRH